jgi:hypothetical protein
MMELYLHFPIRLSEAVLAELSTGTTLPFAESKGDDITKYPILFGTMASVGAVSEQF